MTNMSEIIILMFTYQFYSYIFVGVEIFTWNKAEICEFKSDPKPL